MASLIADPTDMKQIPLTRGEVALVDDEDFPSLCKYRWHAMTIGYAGRGRLGSDGPGPSVIYMHRAILNAPEGVEVDHIDHDGFNNTRSNLRLASKQQNRFHVGKKTRMGSATSKFKGVWQRSGKNLTPKWDAMISLNRKRQYLGRFVNEEDAARAYDAAARKLHGEFANLNFPDDQHKTYENPCP